MPTLILRPLFVLITLAALMVAFFQVTGRLMFAVLDELETGINQWLVPQQIVISGLEGDWHWLNPVASIERIELPAGELRNLVVEVDWLESLIRNRLVARRVTLAEGHLMLERGESGWRLLGGRGGATFNPFDTLYHSDQISVALRLGFVDAAGEVDPAADLNLHYLAINRGGAHRHRLSVRNTACVEGCGLELALDESEAIFLVRPRRLAARLGGTGLTVPAPLLGGRSGRLEQSQGYWWMEDEESAGEADLTFTGFSIEDDLLSGGFHLGSRGEGTMHHLELDGLYLDKGDSRWELPSLFMTFEGGSGRGILRSWTERVDTGPAFSFFAALMPPQTAVFRWLNALQVQATALNVHGYVRFPELDSGFSATVRDVALDGYNGAPWIRGGSGELLGANRMIQLSLNADDLQVQFPDMFHQRWGMDHLSGRLEAFVAGDYFGLRGTNLRAELDGSLASGGFALSRPKEDTYRERLSLLINVDQMTVAGAKAYIPYRLPRGLPEWLDDGPRNGRLDQIAFAYQGQIHTRPFEVARRVEFSGRIADGVVQYHPDWPLVRGLSGQIAVAGRDVRILVDEGISLEATDLAGSRIRLRDDAAFADIDLVSATSVDEALAFIRSTPLEQWMTFVTPDWTGSGPIRMAGRLKVPLQQNSEHIGESGRSDEIQVDLNLDLAGADLDLPGYGVSLGDLEGNVHYLYPHAVTGSDVRGRIFDRPAVFAATADSDTVTFHVDGQAPYESVLELLDISDPGIFRGGFDFQADLHIELADAVSRLDVVSDLTGLALDLPGDFAKGPNDSVPAELEMQFLSDYQSLRFQYDTAQGWLHVKERPLRGAIGFSRAPPMVDSAAEVLVLGGRISGFSVDQVIPDGDGDGAGVIAIPVELAELEVDRIDVNGIVFTEAVLNGRIEPGAAQTDLSLHIDSPDLFGSLVIQADAPLQLDLERLRLPASEFPDDGSASGHDPLSVDVIPDLVDADVRVGALTVGEKDFGAWSFGLRPDATGVTFLDLKAALRGVAISADTLRWESTENRSHFVGNLLAGDLAEVLPLWGYAPSISTESAALTGDLHWRGSPAAMELAGLLGQASFEATNGRFVDVSAGGTDAMKIFSLVNFSTIAKRLNFDFSDVVGDGVSFDSLSARAEFQEGTMQFLEPMSVDGSGSSFRIAGSVDLIGGMLDNEMIVTLPVTKSLPWYAAYIALANPLAGLGVLVGERVLRKPLEQFSSAKYQITGTLDEPQVKFISVWDRSMNQPQVSLEVEEVDPEATSGEQPAAPAGEPEPVEETTAQNTGSTTG